MLTPTDYRNIKNFDTLTYNYQKVFRHRVKKKCRDCLKDIKYILSNYKKLNIILPEKILDLQDILDLLDVYSELKKLHQFKKK